MSEITVIDRGGARSITVVQLSKGLQGPAGPAGLSTAGVEAIAEAEAQELRVDMDALVAATLSI